MYGQESAKIRIPAGTNAFEHHIGHPINLMVFDYNELVRLIFKTLMKHEQTNNDKQGWCPPQVRFPNMGNDPAVGNSQTRSLETIENSWETWRSLEEVYL